MMRKPPAAEVTRRFRPCAEGKETILPADGVLMMETDAAAPCDVEWNIGGFLLRYSWEDGALYAGEERIRTGRLTGGFSVILDGTLLEITADSDLCYSAVDIPQPFSSNVVRIEPGKGCASRFGVLR